MDKRKKDQKIIYKAQHKNLKIEQHGPHIQPGMNACVLEK
jgi:hypothetical protein